MGKEKEIVIVGGGVIGLCAAYFLHERGHAVTVIERGNFTNSCSTGNAGMIVPSHFVPLAAPGIIPLALKWMFNPESPFSIRPRLSRDLLHWCWRFYRAANRSHVRQSAPLLSELNQRSRDLYQAFADQLSFGYQPRGLLLLCRSEQHLQQEAEVAQQAPALGMKAEVLSRSETERLDPGITMDVAGAVYYPGDAFLTPHQFLLALRDYLEAAGVSVQGEQTVQHFVSDGNRIRGVVTDQRSYEADEWVVATGAWSAQLLRPLGIKLPLLAGKGYSVVVPHPPVTPTVCSIMTEARVTLTPMTHGVRLAGTMEMVGLDQRINRRQLQGIFKAIPRYYPQFADTDFEQLEVWTGLRPCSPDGLPYLGRVAPYANLTVATGHAMMGQSLGPITGQLVAQVVTGENPTLDIRALRPGRFGQ